MRGTKIFLDTNVIIYAYDVSAGVKREKAQKILLDLWESGQGLLNTQVLQEFFISVTRKIPQPLELKTAKQIVNDLLSWDIVINDGDSILEAIELHSSRKYSFWDSLIIQAAIKGGASLLLSEDLSGGQNIKGMAIKNPF
jgi:predicted nucleic acid-binding protein